MQGLGEDDAVVGAGGQRGPLAEVSDECGERVRVVDVDDGARRDSIGPEGRRVGVVLDLQHRPPDRLVVPGPEGLDVATVQGGSPVEAVVIAQRIER